MTNEEEEAAGTKRAEGMAQLLRAKERAGGLANDELRTMDKGRAMGAGEQPVEEEGLTTDDRSAPAPPAPQTGIEEGETLAARLRRRREG